jgi:hypothetical protein
LTNPLLRRDSYRAITVPFEIATWKDKERVITARGYGSSKRKSHVVHGKSVVRWGVKFTGNISTAGLDGRANAQVMAGGKQ